LAPEYRFLTRWRVRATPQEVADILADAPALARWWPSVYLDVKELSPGDPKTHVGRVIDLYTKGWLPYTVRWKFTVTESNPPLGFSLRAEGDFEGTGVWTITQDGDYTEATYDWRIAAYKPLLRYGSFVMRPIFGANHRWAMARGLESLDLELLRRRGEKVAAPPGPTFVRR
jgi:polyketide cyclase/dehydrase/lipid transport protein